MDIFAPPEIGCVLYLPGLPGDGSRIYDRSPYGNIGTITGATWVRTPGGLWCLSFAGADGVVNCGSATSLDNLTAFTYEAWVNPTSAGENDAGRIIDKENKAFNFLDATRALRMVIVAATTNADSRTVEILPASTWSYVVATFNNDTDRRANIFIDGKACTYSLQNAAVGALQTEAANNLLIGDDSTSARCWNGRLALLSVFNRVLSAVEIQKHYQATKQYFG